MTEVLKFIIPGLCYVRSQLIASMATASPNGAEVSESEEATGRAGETFKLSIIHTNDVHAHFMESDAG